MEKKRKVSGFGSQFEANQTAEWKEKYCDYTTIENQIVALKKKHKNQESAPITSIQVEEASETKICNMIQNEIDKVAEFYLSKLDEYTVRYQKLQALATQLAKGGENGEGSVSYIAQGSQ